MKSTFRRAALGLLLCATGIAAQAHSPFLMPSTTVLSTPDWITVDAAVSNDLFNFTAFPLALDKLQVTAPDGSLVAPENLSKGKLRNTFDLQLKQPGTYRIAVLNDGVFARWKDKASGQNKRARGTPESIAAQIPADAQEVEITQSAGRIEAFVSVGKPSTLKTIGSGLELVAAAPNDLVKGEKTSFAMLLDGKPAKDLEVKLIAGDTRYRDKVDAISLRTDADGRFSVTWPAPGMFRLEAGSKDDKTTLPHATERRLSYAATLEVMP